jgi:hypothetical protein
LAVSESSDRTATAVLRDERAVRHFGDVVPERGVPREMGIAMGTPGTDVALETADIVLTSDDLTKAAYGVMLGKRTLAVVRQNLVFALGVIVTLVVADLLGVINLPAGVVGHEGSTLLVTLNGLRLLGGLRSAQPSPATTVTLGVTLGSENP